MHLLDHLFVIVLVLVSPLAGLYGVRQLRKRVAAGQQIDRSKLYRNTALHHWLLFCLAMLGWAFSGRPWSEIGISFDFGRNFLIGAVLVTVAIGFLLFQIRRVRVAEPQEIRRIRDSFAALSFMMPLNGNDLGRFYGVSVTAGIVEEILWRGFLIWYCDQYLPLWTAALLVTLAFALAHAYQGLAQLPAIVLVGGAFAGLYLLTGSIWLPIVLHAAIDILQGRMVYEVLRRCDSGDEGINGTSALPAT
jgi:membrane protease YdiL (CAAX protease family)